MAEQQFLNGVWRSASLPYAEDLRCHIRQHLLHLTQSYPSLHPKTSLFTHNDGRTVDLLLADGTIPTAYHGFTYNFPVIIWLMESYPRHPPLVFVNPTRDMIIKRSHPFVSPNSVVSIPYLHSWLFPSSNLVELVQNLSLWFARDPPLYSHPNSTNPNFNSTNSSSKFGSSAAPQPSIPPRDYSNPPSSTFTQDPNPAEVLKKNSINELVDSLHNDINKLRIAMEIEMEGVLGVQSALQNRKDKLRRGVQEMQDEKEALEQELQMAWTNYDILEDWLSENKGETGHKNCYNIELDEAFEVCDGLSKQMLDCTASDSGVEDTMYTLDELLQEGAVPFDQYLRNVRLLSREQFIHRATATKVRAVQMQAQVATMASKASSCLQSQQYAY